MNHVKLLFFATLRERMGIKTLDLDVPADLTIQGLKDRLSAEYPKVNASLKSVVVSINREFVPDESVIPQNAEIGMFPPVSGG